MKETKMKAVILAAGKGKRMRPLTLKTPKPLLKVRGRTFLEHILDSLPSNVNEVIIVIGYKGRQIKKFFGNKYKNKTIYYLDQKVLDGTGSALMLAKPYFKNKERFLILLADELVTKKEVKDCLSREFSWLSRYVDTPENAGVISLSTEGRIVSVIEKPKHPSSNLVVSGLMVINADIFKYKPTKHRNGEYWLTSMMNKFIKDHDVQAVHGVDNLYFTSAKDMYKPTNI